MVSWVDILLISKVYIANFRKGICGGESEKHYLEIRKIVHETSSQTVYLFLPLHNKKSWAINRLLEIVKLR
jgi:hypothetical protein